MAGRKRWRDLPSSTARFDRRVDRSPRVLYLVYNLELELYSWKREETAGGGVEKDPPKKGVVQ